MRQHGKMSVARSSLDKYACRENVHTVEGDKSLWGNNGQFSAETGSSAVRRCSLFVELGFQYSSPPLHAKKKSFPDTKGVVSGANKYFYKHCPGHRVVGPCASELPFFDSQLIFSQMFFVGEIKHKRVAAKKVGVLVIRVLHQYSAWNRDETWCKIRGRL